MSQVESRDRCIARYTWRSVLQVRARIDARWCLAEASHDGVSVLTKTEAVGLRRLADHHPASLSRPPSFSSTIWCSPSPRLGRLLLQHILFALRPSAHFISSWPSSFLHFLRNSDLFTALGY